MQVMILEEDAALRTRITGALAPEGVDVLSFGRLAPAKEAARRANVDILVLGETVEGRLASDVALLAEWRNPRLGSILLSNRDAESAEELFDLIPSLQAVLARGTGARTLARVAIATARSQGGIVIVQDDWRSGEPDAPVLAQDWAADDAPKAEAPVPAPAISPDLDAPGPVWALPLQEEELQDHGAAAPILQAREPGWFLDEDVSESVRALTDVPAEESEPGSTPATEIPDPARSPAQATAEPAWVPAVPVEEAPLGPQPAPVREALAPLRERLFQAQERIAALEMAAPVPERPVRRTEETSTSLLYTLPTFLREGGDLPDSCDDLVAPHPAMLPAAATPRRRLHLA